MAGKKPEIDDLTIAVPVKEEENKGPMVEVFLPEIQSAGDGIKVDQYEHVTIANEQGEKCWKVHRGEKVEVPIDVFIVLKGKYPNL